MKADVLADKDAKFKRIISALSSAIRNGKGRKSLSGQSLTCPLCSVNSYGAKSLSMAKLLLCVAMLMGLQCISVQGQSHVAEPALNLGDTSFLDGLAGPGFLAEEIGDAAHDGTITDATGNAVPGASAVNSIVSLTHVAWLSPKKLLGGWYGVEVVLSAAHVNAGAQGEAGGLGPTTVSPFILQ